MDKNTEDGIMSEINITPFVDVMLVLLIIFMVTAPMMYQGIKIQVPKAKSTSIAPDKENIVISIDKDKKIYINDYHITINFLRSKLSRIMENKNITEVFIKADKNIEYGAVIKVMSEVQLAGIEKIAMITEED